jgi:hypothetical protein
VQFTNVAYLACDHHKLGVCFSFSSVSMSGLSFFLITYLDLAHLSPL